MRVLLANHHLRDMGGSEVYTYYFNRELQRRGFDVEVFSLHLGDLSNQMPNVIDRQELKCRGAGYYDVAFVNHRSCLRLIRACRSSRFTVCTLHGVVPWQEQPLAGADRYVAVSEEVQDRAATLGFDCVVIRNGVDTSRFAVHSPVNTDLRRVLLLSNHPGAHEVVKEASELLGCDFDHVGRYGADSPFVWDVDRRINNSDLVVSVGRGVPESLACGRNVVVFDNRGYYERGIGDGFFLVDMGLESAKANYSGRRYAREFTAESLAQEFNKYDHALSSANRDYALEHHDLTKQVDKYLDLLPSS